MDFKNSLKVKEDSKIRTEIHSIIWNGLKDGKNKEDIMKELLSNERYNKYNTFFNNWIDDQIKKSKRMQKDKTREQ